MNAMLLIAGMLLHLGNSLYFDIEKQRKSHVAKPMSINPIMWVALGLEIGVPHQPRV